MEQHHSTEEAPPSSGCAQCGFPVIEEGYPTPLCKACRTAFIRFPIPRSIKIFGGAVLVVLLFAMVRVPRSLSAGIHLERGKDAMDHARYATAEEEFQKVMKAMPKYTEGEEYLAVASFHNGDLKTFFESIQHLQGKKIEDESMYRDLNELVEKAGQYMPSDSLFALYTAYHAYDSIPEPVYLAYIQKYPDELFPVVAYTGVLLDKKRYASCDSLLDLVLGKDRTYVPALLMKTGLKRERSQLDSAEMYGYHILSLNKESAVGMSSLARTCLKGKRDHEGLEWAQKAVATDPGETYAKTTLALAWHFNKEYGKRDQLLALARQDTTASYQVKYVADVIAGREKFRD